MKVSSRVRVTIPKEIRDQVGLAPGTKVDFVYLPDGVKIVKRSDRAASGSPGTSGLAE
jgi:AbrB family looped-hinge helix DNA binding protein